MTRVKETEADDFFRLDAERLGYFTPDKSGRIRGLWAYYRDFGMTPPGFEADRELTGMPIDQFKDTRREGAAFINDFVGDEDDDD